MALRDYWPFSRRTFATVGSNPSYAKDEPRSYGEGIIRRLRLQQGRFGNDYERHIGDGKAYMDVYLSDPYDQIPFQIYWCIHVKSVRKVDINRFI